MRIALDGMSALRAWRNIRSGMAPKARIGRREDLFEPDPSPYKRWCSQAFDLGFLGFDDEFNEKSPLEIAVPSASLRIRSKGVRCVVYSTLPPRSFVDVGNGVLLASPELLFVEMGERMSSAVQLLLGHELCGTFSRNAQSPRDGEVTFGVHPLTTASAIREYANSCRYLRGVEQARIVAGLLYGNAWSPMEAIVATLLALGPEDFGYDMGELVLNPRVATAGGRASRVPDILFAGTHVGINYDGDPHFLSRDTMVEDKRRDRELMCAGYSVFPVTIEDLHENGALDEVVLQALGLIERETGQCFDDKRALLAHKQIAARRQKLIRSLLPGRWAAELSRQIDAEPSPSPSLEVACGLILEDGVHWGGN